ncbi:MAG: hypothetical protein ACFCD0_13425 [Gemmataceae bacterium]
MSDEVEWKIGEWLWDQRDNVAKKLQQLYQWFRSKKTGGIDSGPGILIVGAGGVGKTTFGGFLSNQFDLLANPPGEYVESLKVEKVVLPKGEDDEETAEAVIPPGQEHRRDATWSELLSKVAAGMFRGIILISAYGYHSLGNISFKKHRLYPQNRGKNKFLQAFLEDRRNDELRVLEQLVPHLKTNPEKLWFLSLISKQDLWWSNRIEVKDHYENGSYGQQIRQILQHCGSPRFRHEFVYGSFVIGNFITGVRELLQPNTASYDHHEYVQSLRRLFEAIDALREWESQQ